MSIQTFNWWTIVKKIYDFYYNGKWHSQHVNAKPGKIVKQVIRPNWRLDENIFANIYLQNWLTKLPIISIYIGSMKTRQIKQNTLSVWSFEGLEMEEEVVNAM